MKKFRTAAAMLAACTLLAACNGDSTGSSGRTSYLRFNASGDVDGSFDATGRYPGISRVNDRSFAVAVDVGSEGLTLAGSEAGGGSFPDALFIYFFTDVDEGTYSCTEDDVSSLECPFEVELLLGYDWDNDEADVGYTLRGGQVRVTERTSDRVRGTFTLDLSDNTIAGDTQVNGSFDMEIRDFGDISFNRRPAASRRPATR
jgi:hypothetical protein